MVLPALTEATSPLFRPVKYALFPPLGLATLAAYLGDDDEVTGPTSSRTTTVREAPMCVGVDCTRRRERWTVCRRSGAT